jgi:hypothetical protein
MSSVRHPAIEHGSSASATWLRARRTRLALWIALVEGILVVTHVIPKWPSLAVAAAVLVLYLTYGRTLRGAGGEISWIAAGSQALVVLIPILVLIVGTLALVAVGILAVLAIVFLLADRR